MAQTLLLEPSLTFSSFSHLLDIRILRALADLGFAKPTLVQAKAIPLALEGRDILARARTGSGKTAAYCIPVVQKILSSKSAVDPTDVTRQSTRALICVPTRELAEQVTAYLQGLLAYCEKDVVIANIAGGVANHLQRMLLSDKPDLVIGTPARVLAMLQAKSLSLSNLESLVIDEADLILSYGHDEDVRHILSGDYLPRVYQSFLMSATMTKDVEVLKGLVLRSPAILRLEEDEDEAANLSQFYVRCSEVDKFLLTYVILKLKLVNGKCIMFVNHVDRCYRLKLFLEQFSIKSCVLNSELPLNSRFHIVQQFNKGVYDYIIATDESGGQMGDESDSEEEETVADDDAADTPEADAEPPTEQTAKASRKRKRPAANPDPDAKSRKRKTKNGDREYGVSRGIDFIDVACVINFDLPTSARSYTHRVGRTARAGRTGMALSYVVPHELWKKDKAVSSETAENDEKVFAKVEKEQGARGSAIKEYKFNQKQVDAFRYRMEDALRSVTRNAIKEARIKELKGEILNSDKLKTHFEDNPTDLEYLRHDKPLHPTRVQPHMKHVPSYLLPRTAAAVIAGERGAPTGEEQPQSEGFVPFRKDGAKRGGARGRGRGGRGGRGGGRGGKKSDPLKKFGR